MQKLAKREEQIMQALWQLEKAIIKEIIAKLPSPKPHYNSVATILRILEDKGFAKHETIGSTFMYYPLVTKNDYQRREVRDLMSRYFNNSYSSMLAFFAKEENISKAELDDIINIIKSKEA